MHRDELELIEGRPPSCGFPAGQTLARQGENGHEFVVIVEGTARVEIGDQTIATIESGDFFGEIALLDGGPRTATVIAETDLVAEVIGQHEFAALVERTPHLAHKLLVGLARGLRAVNVRLAE